MINEIIKILSKKNCLTLEQLCHKLSIDEDLLIALLKELEIQSIIEKNIISNSTSNCCYECSMCTKSKPIITWNIRKN